MKHNPKPKLDVRTLRNLQKVTSKNAENVNGYDVFAADAENLTRQNQFLFIVKVAEEVKASAPDNELEGDL
jgi:hypothetical protein